MGKVDYITGGGNLIHTENSKDFYWTVSNTTPERRRLCNWYQLVRRKTTTKKNLWFYFLFLEADDLGTVTLPLWIIHSYCFTSSSSNYCSKKALPWKITPNFLLEETRASHFVAAVYDTWSPCPKVYIGYQIISQHNWRNLFCFVKPFMHWTCSKLSVKTVWNESISPWNLYLMVKQA